MPSIPPSLPALDQALIERIASEGGVKRYPAHAVIINEGDSADTPQRALRSRPACGAASARRWRPLVQGV